MTETEKPRYYLGSYYGNRQGYGTSSTRYGPPYSKTGLNSRYGGSYGGDTQYPSSSYEGYDGYNRMGCCGGYGGGGYGGGGFGGGGFNDGGNDLIPLAALVGVAFIFVYLITNYNGTIGRRKREVNENYVDDSLFAKLPTFDEEENQIKTWLQNYPNGKHLNDTFYLDAQLSESLHIISNDSVCARKLLCSRLQDIQKEKLPVAKSVTWLSAIVSFPAVLSSLVRFGLDYGLGSFADAAATAVSANTNCSNAFPSELC